MATQLGVPASLLDEWINGDATMPDRKLVVLADVVKQGLAYPLSRLGAAPAIRRAKRSARPERDRNEN
jgi:hypothetical protein